MVYSKEQLRLKCHYLMSPEKAFVCHPSDWAAKLATSGDKTKTMCAIISNFQREHLLLEGKKIRQPKINQRTIVNMWRWVINKLYYGENVGLIVSSYLPVCLCNMMMPLMGQT